MTVTPERIVAASCYVHKIPTSEFYKIVSGCTAKTMPCVARTIAAYVMRTRIVERGKDGNVRELRFIVIARVIGWKSESAAWLAVQRAEAWKGKKDARFLKVKNVWLLSASGLKTLPFVAGPKMKSISRLLKSDDAIDCEECAGMGCVPYPHGQICDQCHGHGRYRPWIKVTEMVRA